MTGPSEPTLSASLDALTHDAMLWAAACRALTEISGSVEGLALSDYQFTFLGHGAGTAYQRVIEAVRGHLAEGVLAIGDTADELDRVRQLYETTDEAARARLRGLWQPQPQLG